MTPKTKAHLQALGTILGFCLLVTVTVNYPEILFYIILAASLLGMYVALYSVYKKYYEEEQKNNQQ